MIIPQKRITQGIHGFQQHIAFLPSQLKVFNLQADQLKINTVPTFLRFPTKWYPPNESTQQTQSQATR